jgi:Poxvirus A32 protein
MTTSTIEGQLALRHPFTSIVAGPTQVGKTEFVFKFLTHLRHVMNPPATKVIWCFTQWQPAYDRIKRLQSINVQFIQVTSIDELNKSTLEGSEVDQKEPRLLVLDDLMTTSSKNKLLTEIFTQGCHHWNMSCLLIVQSLFFDGLRTLHINCHYHILMSSPGDKLQLLNFAKQRYPGKLKYFLASYNDATED